jgi:hypothetical protein
MKLVAQSWGKARVQLGKIARCGTRASWPPNEDQSFVKHVSHFLQIGYGWIRGPAELNAASFGIADAQFAIVVVGIGRQGNDTNPDVGVLP